VENNFTYIKENKVLSNEQTLMFFKIFNNIFHENIYEAVQENTYEFSKNKILNEPFFCSLLDIIQKKFTQITGFNDLNFKKLWLVSTSSDNIKKDRLPYVPHIDKNRYLKAMVYLHDVSLNHGPIHLGKVKREIDLEDERKKFSKDYKEKGLNTIIDEKIEGNLVPMTGKAGDVVFFDTNTPHKAGIVSDGYCRKILRFDFERSFFNSKKTLFNFIINQFKN
jgi:hypothetical protein